MHDGHDFKPGLTLFLLATFIVCLFMAVFVLGSN